MCITECFGTGLAVLRSEQDLQPGRWSTLHAGRDVREGRLSVDGETPVTGRSPGSRKGLNLGTSLYIGGYDKTTVKLHPSVEVDRGFEGCISSVSITTMYNI